MEHKIEIDSRDWRSLQRRGGIADQHGFQPVLRQQPGDSKQNRASVHAPF